jgi:hypothetical protein
MHVMGDDVRLLRHDLDDQVAAQIAKEAVAKAVGAMGRVAMKPDRSVAAEHDHTVDEAERDQRPAEVRVQEQH